MLERVIQHFGLQIQSMEEVEDSHSSTVYKCTLSSHEQVYVKIPFSKVKYQRELEAYQLLKGTVSIPKLVDVWDGDAACPGAFLLSDLKGEPLTSQATPSVAYQVGMMHATMHSLRPPHDRVLKGIKNEYPNWSAFVENQFYSFAEHVKEVLDERLYQQALKKFEEMKNQLPIPDGPSFVHMDFRPANIIVDQEKVAGIIDFESVRFGSTEVDFTKLYRDFLSADVELYRAYQDGYTSIRPIMDLEKVLPFYLFTDAFNSIGWCKRRGIERNALFLEENLERLKMWL